jgi:hypothetical protein
MIVPSIHFRVLTIQCLCTGILHRSQTKLIFLIIEIETQRAGLRVKCLKLLSNGP